MKMKFAYTMYIIIIINNFHCTHSSSFHNWRSWILLGTVYMEGRGSQYQEDPRRRIILAPNNKNVFCIQFTRKELYLQTVCSGFR